MIVHLTDWYIDWLTDCVDIFNSERPLMTPHPNPNQVDKSLDLTQSVFTMNLSNL